MENEQPVFAVGDAVLVVETANDGKLGTILRLVKNGYLVALEDGTETVLPADNLSLRR